MSSITPLNIIFAGTPDFSAVLLESILSQRQKSQNRNPQSRSPPSYNVSAVYCQPDRRVGRGKKLAFGAVKRLASERGIPVEQPTKFNQEIDVNGRTALDRLASYQPDLMVVAAYGLILPESVLSVPRYGCVNIHASLLPRWRGAAPIQRAIEAGDKQTGVTIMQMDRGLDTGNMLSTYPCDISFDETGSSLHDRLAVIGSQAINEFLDSFSKNAGSSLSPGEKQNDQLATYAHKLSKSEAEIDWQKPAAVIERKIRAYNSWPVSFTYVGSNRLRIWQACVFDETSSGSDSDSDFHSSDGDGTSGRDEKGKSVTPSGTILDFGKQGVRVQCGDGRSILLTQLQADGSRAMTAGELLNSKSQWFSDHPILGKQLR